MILIWGCNASCYCWYKWIFHHFMWRHVLYQLDQRQTHSIVVPGYRNWTVIGVHCKKLQSTTCSHLIWHRAEVLSQFREPAAKGLMPRIRLKRGRRGVMVGLIAASNYEIAWMKGSVMMGLTCLNRLEFNCAEALNMNTGRRKPTRFRQEQDRHHM